MGFWHEMIIQILTIATTYYMMRQLSGHKKICMVATLMYVICPYRSYSLRTDMDMGRVIVFTVLPLLIAFVFAMAKEERVWLYLLLIAVCIGVIAYADIVVSCFVIGFICLYILWVSAWKLMIAVLGGIALSSMEWMALIKYLLTGVTKCQNVSLSGIMSGGYTLGRYMSTYSYPEGKPGIGILLMSVMMLLFWLVMTDAQYRISKQNGYILFVILITGAMASVWFPWDIVQRISVITLRFVPLIGELNVFVGMMSLAISVLSVEIFEKLIEKLK